MKLADNSEIDNNVNSDDEEEWVCIDAGIVLSKLKKMTFFKTES